ncbi:MAG TPA: hypothetical protein VEC99_01830 [Clostridia bacterium]|nr:hypothetical protein [Clostridia bacterium]
MINQRYCPLCNAPAAEKCQHLALAVEGRDFVRHCVELCHGLKEWQVLCCQRQQQERHFTPWPSEQDDFTWLETAFCDRFLRHLHWFGGLDHEWRSGEKPEQGGFWVLLWSKDPRKLWWELREELERQGATTPQAQSSSPWLVGLAPK